MKSGKFVTVYLSPNLVLTWTGIMCHLQIADPARRAQLWDQGTRFHRDVPEARRGFSITDVNEHLGPTTACQWGFTNIVCVVDQRAGAQTRERKWIAIQGTHIRHADKASESGASCRR